MNSNHQNPPKWPDRILKWFCAEEHLEILQGDLQELYEYRLATKGRRKARLHYIKDSFDMLRRFAIKKKKSKLKNNRSAMFKNYFKISYRNMLRHKTYAGINILGLSAGISCFLLIFLYVQDELSYDRYHEHANDTYRVITNSYNEGGELNRSFTYTSPMHGQELRESYPQVVSAVRFNPWNFPLIKYKDAQFEESFFNFVEPEIFEVFSFNFIEGRAETALNDPYTVIITESTAKKYFGDENAYGKTIEVIEQGTSLNYLVTGVVEDFPVQSHMTYNFMASWASYESSASANDLNDYYGNYNYPTYIRLSKEAEINDLTILMPAMLDNYIDNIDGFVPSEKIGVSFQKLTDIHLNQSAGAGGTSKVYYVYLFSVIGILVLLIACVNYMNLSTAKYSNRLKEIGVRKVMGAKRRNISQQFLAESVLYAFLALAIGFGISLLAIPMINDFAEKELSLNPFDNQSIILVSIALSAMVGLLSGSYPSLFMARFNAVNALKNGKAKINNRSLFRTGLVVFQFTITIALIIGVTVVDRQVSFIRNQDVGFERDQVVNFWASPEVNQNLETYKSQLLTNPNIVSASASSRIPTGRLGDALGAHTFNEKTKEKVGFRLPFILIDADYFKVYDIELLSGTAFSKDIKSDSTQSFILNETAIKSLGWQSPEEAIGQRMDYGWYSGFVSGVVKDFHFESLHSAIEPMLFLQSDNNKRAMSVKITGQNIPETLSFLEDQFKLYNPDRTFNPTFVDDLFNAQYETEERLSQISKVFSFLAILIACLGLLGLVAFTMEQRAKEISVRKVLGASVQGILMMINRGYILLIGIAFLIAVPLAYYFLSDWLNTFAYHIQLGISLFAFAGLLSIGIAIVTISSQALKFALANPVKWLKNE